jgi:hypothetical protein
VDPRTINHLTVSARNRDLARVLLSPSLSGLQPSPWEWVAVIAFYAAVHAVNAYLWETRRYAPSTHGERSTEVRFNLPISACRTSYQNLSHAGYYARYDEEFSLTEREARGFLDVDFRRVEATVMQALGQPAPVW